MPDTFDFLGLPGEVQTIVYHHAFVKEGSYIGVGRPGKVMNSTGFKNEARRFRNLNFLLTCRKVYNEASHIFYADNGFEFYNINVLAEFLEAIGAAHRSLITRVRIHYSTQHAQWQAFKKFRYLLSCISVQSLDLDARFTPVDHRDVWCSIPIINAHQLFLGSDTEVLWGNLEDCGQGCDLVAVADDTRNQETWNNICDSLEAAMGFVVQQRDDASRWPNSPNLFIGKPRKWGARGDAAAYTNQSWYHNPLAPAYRLMKWPDLLPTKCPIEYRLASEHCKHYTAAFNLRSKVLGRDPVIYTADPNLLLRRVVTRGYVKELTTPEEGPMHHLPHDWQQNSNGVDERYASVVDYLISEYETHNNKNDDDDNIPPTPPGKILSHTPLERRTTISDPATAMTMISPSSTTPPPPATQGSYSNAALLTNTHPSPIFLAVFNRFRKLYPLASRAQILRLAAGEYDQLIRGRVVRPAI